MTEGSTVLTRDRYLKVPVNLGVDLPFTDCLYQLRAARLGFREVEVPGADRPLVRQDATRTYLWMPPGRNGAIPPGGTAVTRGPTPTARLP